MNRDKLLELAKEAGAFEGLAEDDVIFAGGSDSLERFATLLSQQEQEPYAWAILDCINLRPCSVVFDKTETEDYNPEHIAPLYLARPSQAQEPFNSACNDIGACGCKEPCDKPEPAASGAGDELQDACEHDFQYGRCTECGEFSQQSAQVTDDRFFMDHGLWHDRVTGQHLYTQDQYDEEKRMSFKEGYERRNEELALSRAQHGQKLVPMEPTHQMHLAGEAQWENSALSVPNPSAIYRAMLAAAPSTQPQGDGK